MPFEEMNPDQKNIVKAIVRDLQRQLDTLEKVKQDQKTEQEMKSMTMGQTIDTLSKGFKRRVGLAQAILHDPEVLSSGVESGIETRLRICDHDVVVGEILLLLVMLL